MTRPAIGPKGNKKYRLRRRLPLVHFEGWSKSKFCKFSRMEGERKKTDILSKSLSLSRCLSRAVGFTGNNIHSNDAVLNTG